MGRWRLLITTLPLVAAVVAAALIRDYVLDFDGLAEFSEITPFLAAVALIAGLMLAGVLADYKESERIPGEIATTLETLGDTVQVVVALDNDVDAQRLEGAHRDLVTAVDDWLTGQIGVDRCYAALDAFREAATRMHPAAGVNYTIRSLGEMHNLRRLITRVDVIKRTSFIAEGYILLHLLVATTILLLLLAKYKSPMAEYVLIALFSLVYIYLVRLVRDVDNPFALGARGTVPGSAEVDPFPMREYRQRLDARQEQPRLPQ